LKYIRQSPVKRSWAGHFELGGFSVFLEKVERTDAMSDSELEALIQTTAQDDTLCFYNVEGDFDVVSVDNLLTKWEGVEVELMVYRRESDNKILVKYPIDLTWEGSKPGEQYRLEMNVKNETTFNGENGRLLDANGDEIKCYCLQNRKTIKKRKQST
jgi:hypothetical protein